MGFLSRLATRVVPDDWRQTVGYDLMDEAARRGLRGIRGDAWIAWQAIRVGIAFRWRASGVPSRGRSSRPFIPIRDAWRALRSGAGSTLFALVILTAAIAAATVTFSVVDAVVLRSLPFPDNDRIVMFGRDSPRVHSHQEFTAWRDRANAFAAVGTTDITYSALLPGDSNDEPIRTMQATASLFEVLRVRPVHGRLFTADNEVEGRHGVALIGYDLWQRAYGGDPSALGQLLRMRNPSRRPHIPDVVEIVGVMPDGFTYPLDIFRPEVWIPYVPRRDARPDSRSLRVIGRLRDGVTTEEAQTQAAGIMASVAAAHGQTLRGDWRPRLVSLQDTLIGDAKGSMMLVLLAAGLLMVIACVNVANLMLARAVDRARDLAVRASLGASARQLGATLLTESLMLSLTAGGLGIVVAYWGLDIVKATLPPGLFRAETIEVDRRVLAVAVSAAVSAGVFFGLVPAWHAARVQPGSLLSHGSPAVTLGHRRWRETFLVAEIALVGAMLVVSTLFVASFVRIVRADLGFGRSGLLALNLEDHRGSSMPLVNALQALPGVASVAASSGPPPLLIAAYSGSHSISSVRLSRPGDHTNSEGSIEPTILQVSPAYFATAGIPVVQGRSFDEADASREVAVIDEQTAGFLFPDRTAIGAYLPVVGTAPARQIIGVARPVVTDGPDTGAGAQVYWPMAMGAGRAQFVLIRLRAGLRTSFQRSRRRFSRSCHQARLRPQSDRSTMRSA